MVANTANKLRRLSSESLRSRSSLVNEGNVNEGTVECIEKIPPSGLMSWCFYLTRGGESPPLSDNSQALTRYVGSVSFAKGWEKGGKKRGYRAEELQRGRVVMIHHFYDEEHSARW
jgi:hypothetical protein